MKNTLRLFLLFVFQLPLFAASFDSYNGLLMVGYQGWFNTPGDGAGRGWRHYNGKNGFRPGSASVDFWPDVGEYEKTYETEFRFADGTPARVFSSHDESTVDLHFRWMKEYGIDGAFVQRFVVALKSKQGKSHCDTVLTSAMKSARKHTRAVCIMYDLSGMKSEDTRILIDDIAALAETHRLHTRAANPSYLWHNGKPLVVVWGIGFADKRHYNLDDAEKIIGELRRQNFSVMLGVPTYWRILGRDTVSDPKLHSLIKKSDIIMPWFVGRYNGDNYSKTFPRHIADDIAWCERNKIDYAPLCFPGFSWKNIKGADAKSIPRNKGEFFWRQLVTSIRAGAKSIYVAMFDEIDEGTAIFKCATEVPVGSPGSTFVLIEQGVRSDHYLFLAGEAAKMLRKEKPLSATMPVAPPE